MTTPQLHALLIGIDYYLPNKLPNGGSYSNLSGCVRDISLVEKFLQTTLGVRSESILKLTASHTGAATVLETPEQLPTYENMVAAFKKIGDIAQPGEQVYIHYSGHGGRTQTNYPEIKGVKGLDESLVPMDIGKPEGRYLLDIELAYLLQQMVDKGLIVTIVLDCCHSGGAARSRVAVRGVDEVDSTSRPTQSLVATDEELVANWQRLIGETAHYSKLTSVWFEPKGYVLLAACRESELASEFVFDDGGYNGALTYWFVNSLERMGTNVTFKMLHNRIVANIHSDFTHQTPQLQGDGDRVIFANSHLPSPDVVNVMQADYLNQKVLLNTGTVQAVRTGAQFAIYPLGVTDFSQIHQRKALVEIADVEATNSWAKITDTLCSKLIESGDQAVLVNSRSIHLRSTVGLVVQDMLPSTINQDEALQKIKQALVEDKSGFVALAQDDRTANYNVVVNANSEYEICDAGGKSIPNLRPALCIDAKNAATQVVQRLVHLTKYRNIKKLDNHDEESPLVGKLVVELYKAQPDYQPSDKPQPQPLDRPGNIPTVSKGEWFFLRVQNKSTQVLNVTVMGLLSDWSIVQIYPKNSLSIPFDPSQERYLPLRGNLLSGYTHSSDVIKVLATVESTNFRWLQLPVLDQPRSQNENQRRPTNALEELLAALVGDDVRHVEGATLPNLEWVTAQVEVQVNL